jgi:hypothetical protein
MTPQSMPVVMLATFDLKLASRSSLQSFWWQCGFDMMKRIVTIRAFPTCMTLIVWKVLYTWIGDSAQEQGP